MPDSGRVPRESIYIELLRALASDPSKKAAPAPDLAKALGTSAQFVVAKLQPLVRAGLVSRHSGRTGRAYAISEEGRHYLVGSKSRKAGAPRRPGRDKRK